MSHNKKGLEKEVDGDINFLSSFFLFNRKGGKRIALEKGENAKV